MRETYVNRYVVVLGRGGLGGIAYEIHATGEDLLLLAKSLEMQLARYREGNHALQEVMKQQGMEWREDVPFPVLSEYVTLSEVRTDRTCIRFCVEKSLEAHHVIKSEKYSAVSVASTLAKMLWFLVFPLIGVSACIWAFLKLISG